jgi:hypothetical protein
MRQSQQAYLWTTMGAAQWVAAGGGHEAIPDEVLPRGEQPGTHTAVCLVQCYLVNYH